MQSQNRIAVVDVLRAVALLGIIIAHSAGGFLGGRPPTPDFMKESVLDQMVSTVGFLTTFGKFFTIFSFLFGLSFALQMRSAEAKGTGFVGRFTWRLVVLALIALVHNVFFAGDILLIYAILGLFLIPFRAVNTKVLVVVALVLVLNIPGVLLSARQLNAPPPTPEEQAAGAQVQAQAMQAAQRQYDIKRSGSLGEVAHANLTDGMMGKFMFQFFTGRAWITFGLFLLGLCAGRLELFRDNDVNRRFFRKLLWISGTVALITTAIAIVRPMSFRIASVADLLGSFSFTVQQMALSAFYLAAITLLYWRKPAQGLLSKLAPVGKMGLTVYLTQTVFGVLLFYGIGLGMLGKMGTAAAIAAGILFFIVQVFLARWWMARFSMGPVEWLWRSLTYFRLQPWGQAKPA